MAIETVLLATSLAATAAGTGISAYASVSAAKAQARAEEYNAQVAANNAAQAEAQAKANADLVRNKNRKLGARQRALYAASGVQLNGTVLDVLKDSEIQGELDALATEYSGVVAATSYRSESSLHRMKAKSASSSAGFAVAGTVLGGLGSMASTTAAYYKR